MTVDQMASELWEAYRKSCGGFSTEGETLPKWNVLVGSNQPFVRHWKKMAAKALEYANKTKAK